MEDGISLRQRSEVLCRKAADNPKLNKIFSILKALPQTDQPLTHRFTHDQDGKVNLYIRQILNPAGSRVITKIHKSEHPYVLLSGKMAVYTEEDGWKMIPPGVVGITKPGTRRVIHAFTDCQFVTFHATDTDDIKVIEDRIIFPHDVEAARIEDLPAELFAKK